MQKQIDAIKRPELRVALPPASQFFDQDLEWCVVDYEGRWDELRFHDYGRLYRVPGLYEKLFGELLRCNSPRVVARALLRECERFGRRPESLRVLDLGAGNGMVGEELKRAGVGSLVGVDILPEAKVAAFRDRPGLYEDYLVTDLAEENPVGERELQLKSFNALVCVAALGYDDVPARAFLKAFSLLEPGGLVAFNIKEDFLSALDGSGFARMLAELIGSGRFLPLKQRRYRHRNATSGEPLYYALVVGQKRRAEAEIKAHG